MDTFNGSMRSMAPLCVLIAIIGSIFGTYTMLIVSMVCVGIFYGVNESKVYALQRQVDYLRPRLKFALSEEASLNFVVEILKRENIEISIDLFREEKENVKLNKKLREMSQKMFEAERICNEVHTKLGVQRQVLFNVLKFNTIAIICPITMETTMSPMYLVCYHGFDSKAGYQWRNRNVFGARCPNCRGPFRICAKVL